MTLTERGSSPYKAKLARQIDELRENQEKQRVIIQIILDEKEIGYGLLIRLLKILLNEY